MYTPKKELGQNFLTSKEEVKKMVLGLDISPGDEIIEIGPGLGAVTEEITHHDLEDNILVHAVEVDVRFVETLKQRYLADLNMDIVEANILDWLPQFVPQPGKNVKVIGSLPYYITSPIIHAIVYMNFKPTTCVLLIQKEVAQKVSNTVPDASYFSTFVQSFYDVDYLGKVDRKYFNPKPTVDGGIIKMRLKVPGFSVDEIRKYEGFLHRGFASPRKKINKVFTPEQLALIGLDGNLRPQNVYPDQWVKAFNILRAQ